MDGNDTNTLISMMHVALPAPKMRRPGLTQSAQRRTAFWMRLATDQGQNFFRGISLDFNGNG
jgi:hypothetical protein